MLLHTAADERPRLLFLAHRLPFPLDNGAAIRTYHLLRLLGERFRVEVLCFHRRAHHPTDALRRAGLCALSSLGATDSVPIPQEWSRLRFVGDHLRSLALGRPYAVLSHDSPTFRGRLRDALASRSFDLVHVDSLDLAAHLPALAGHPVVCGHHNVESRLLARRAAVESSPLRRSYLRHQASRTADEERRHCAAVALNVTVSPADEQALSAIAPGARIAVVPNGVDTRALRPDGAPATIDLVCVGGLDWGPNRDALEWLGSQVLPRVRKLRPGVSVRWVGRASDAQRRHWTRRFGIELTGRVDDAVPHVRAARCYVVPLRAGGGTRLKLLEAWALGAAVVSTAIGCEGLDARDGENLLVADDAGAFAGAVLRVLDDAALRARLGEAARATVESRYDWDAIGRSMVPLYLEIAGRGTRRRRDHRPAAPATETARCVS